MGKDFTFSGRALTRDSEGRRKPIIGTKKRDWPFGQVPGEKIRPKG